MECTPSDLHHLVFVRFDRARRQVQGRRDLLHALPFDDQAQHVALSRGQLRLRSLGGVAIRSMTSLVSAGVR